MPFEESVNIVPTRLHTANVDFSTGLKKLLDSRRREEASVADTVRDILADVKARGDAAVIDYTAKFDRLTPTALSLRITSHEIDYAERSCAKEVRDALALAAKRIRAFHEKQTPRDLDYTDETGVRLGMRFSAIRDVGMYVPGGRASYPSSVLMNAIPAKVAGVQRLVMVVPTPDGIINPAILVAARLSGVDEIYRIGGAQAIGALAYGTESVAPVKLIVGPGNAYVAEAKRQVFGLVGIDMIAGPSEVLIVADNTANATWVAADLLSQAEHDAEAQSILLTDDAALADAVEGEVTRLLQHLSRREIAEASWRDYGGIIVTDDVQKALPVINHIAPEHLELCVADPETLLPGITEAGAVFLGHHTPEALGDYLAGPSHVLPTMQTAAFSSGLSVHTFLKKFSLIGCPAASFAALAPATQTLAENEGLSAHALSVSLRTHS